ncbi:glucoside xylosyltransferase 2 isoform 3-T3 [Macrochelys suwanniensis]
MKLYCKLVALLLCLGVLLLLSLFVGSADEPPPKGAGGARSLPVSSGPGGRAHPLLAHFPPVQAAAAAAAEEGAAAAAAAAQISKREPRLSRNPGKRSPARGKFANVRRPGEQKHLKELPSLQWMHLAVVACGDRLEETLIMLKSAVLFSYRKLKFHIFAEDSLKPEFEKKVILKDVDSLLYVDTDVLFLRPIDDIWSFLKEFNSTQLAAMAPEHEIPKIGWYSRFARHPYYGTTGVNSGVMLMNLTRIRNTQFKNSMIPTGLMWEEMLYPLYQKYKNYITWGDQDLLNIIFYFNPECLYVFPCQWNYRPDHCMYGSNCKGAEEEGISVLHGNRGVYHDDKQPTFKALYEVIRDFPFEDNLFQSLYYPLQSKFLDTVHTLCGRIPQVFLKQIEKTMKKVYENRVIVHVGANYRY